MSPRSEVAALVPPSSSAARSRVSWFKVALFSALPLLLLIAVGEVGLRVWASSFRTPYERYNAMHGRLELVPNIRYTAAHGLEFRINSRGFLGPEFDATKPPGLYRIFAVGDSCTFGAGFWRETYPAVMAAILAASGQDDRVEVINAGIEGYNSEFALDRIRTELLAYQPDMLILYIGWNDLMKIDPRNAAASGRHAGLARMLERSFLVKAYGKALFYYIRPAVMKPKVGPDPSATHELAAFVPARYRANLEKAVELLRNHGVMPVLVTLPTVVTPDMTHSDLERAHVFFPYYPAGYGVEAFLRLLSAYNDVIRRTAAEYRVPLVDLETALARPDRRELFWDTMHPSQRGHRLIAEALARTVQDVRRTADKP